MSQFLSTPWIRIATVTAFALVMTACGKGQQAAAPAATDKAAAPAPAPVATMIFLIPQVLWLSSKTTQIPPPPAASRMQRLRERLESRFAPAQLTVEDESHLHEGHAGAAGGQSHFRIRIVSEAFRGIPAVARHRLVYAAVDDLLKTDIHALAIEALPPD